LKSSRAHRIEEERRPLTRRADAPTSPRGGEVLRVPAPRLSPWGEAAAVCGGGEGAPLFLDPAHPRIHPFSGPQVRRPQIASSGSADYVSAASTTARAGWLLLRVFGHDGGVDAAADVEVAFHAHPARQDGGHQIVEDLVGHRLVKSALVAIRPQIELQRLQFHT